MHIGRDLKVPSIASHNMLNARLAIKYMPNTLNLVAVPDLHILSDIFIEMVASKIIKIHVKHKVKNTTSMSQKPFKSGAPLIKYSINLKQSFIG